MTVPPITYIGVDVLTDGYRHVHVEQDGTKYAIPEP